jgi:hypothetical protein
MTAVRVICVPDITGSWELKIHYPIFDGKETYKTIMKTTPETQPKLRLSSSYKLFFGVLFCGHFGTDNFALS